MAMCCWEAKDSLLQGLPTRSWHQDGISRLSEVIINAESRAAFLSGDPEWFELGDQTTEIWEILTQATAERCWRADPTDIVDNEIQTFVLNREAISQTPDEIFINEAAMQASDSRYRVGGFKKIHFLYIPRAYWNGIDALMNDPQGNRFPTNTRVVAGTYEQTNTSGTTDNVIFSTEAHKQYSALLTRWTNEHTNNPSADPPEEARIFAVNAFIEHSALGASAQSTMIIYGDGGGWAYKMRVSGVAPILDGLTTEEFVFIGVKENIEGLQDAARNKVALAALHTGVNNGAGRGDRNNTFYDYLSIESQDRDPTNTTFTLALNDREATYLNEHTPDTLRQWVEQNWSSPMLVQDAFIPTYFRGGI